MMDTQTALFVLGNLIALGGLWVRLENRLTRIETILTECPYCHRSQAHV